MNEYIDLNYATIFVDSPGTPFLNMSILKWRCWLPLILLDLAYYTLHPELLN